MVKNLPASATDSRDAGSIPGLGRSRGEGNGNPFQFSYLGNPMHRGLQSMGSERVFAYLPIWFIVPSVNTVTLYSTFRI